MRESLLLLFSQVAVEEEWIVGSEVTWLESQAYEHTVMCSSKYLSVT